MFQDIGKVLGGIISFIVYLALIPVITQLLQSAMSQMSGVDPTFAPLISVIISLLPMLLIFSALARLVDSF